MSAYQMIQSDAFSPHDLCEVQIHASHRCLHFNNPRYMETAIEKSGLSSMLWSFLSLPACEKHPITLLLKDLMGAKKFDLPHMKTTIKEHYQRIPGIRVNEFARDNKRVTVAFEMTFWATIGQLKLLKEADVQHMSIEVHTAVGKMQI